MPQIIQDYFDGKTPAQSIDVPYDRLPHDTLISMAVHGNAEALQALKGKVATVSKGDVEGHEFHGNQWTGGHGGATKEDYETLKKVASEKGALPPDVQDRLIRSLNGQWHGRSDNQEIDYNSDLHKNQILLAGVLSRGGLEAKNFPYGRLPKIISDRDITSKPYGAILRNETPLLSSEEQGVRELMAQSLRSSAPCIRMSNANLLQLLNDPDQQFKSGSELNKTGAPTGMGTQKYLETRERIEDENFGSTSKDIYARDENGNLIFPENGYRPTVETPATQPSERPVYGTMTPDGGVDYLEANKPEDVAQAISFLGHDFLTAHLEQPSPEEVMSNPSKYSMYSYTFREGGQTGSGRGIISNDILAQNLKGKWGDTSEPMFKSMRITPLANADGSLNADALVGSFNKEIGSSAYGGAQVVLKSDAPALQNAMMTVGDSSYQEPIPMPLQMAMNADPRIPVFPWAYKDQSGDIQIKEPDYMEIQMFTHPTISDIAQVRFTGGAPSPALVQVLNDKNIPYTVIGSPKPFTAYQMKPDKWLALQANQK